MIYLFSFAEIHFFRTSIEVARQVIDVTNSDECFVDNVDNMVLA